MSSSVGAGVGRSLVRRPAMPVKAQRCRIVAEPAIRGLEDDLRQMLYGFARVHLATGCEDRLDVDAFSVSLEHAVGEEHDSIAWLKWQRLHAILVAAVDAKRRVGRERQAVNATVTEPQRRRMTRVDDRRGLAAQVHSRDLSGNEAAAPSEVRESCIGAARLLCQPESGSAPVAQ